MGTCITCDMPMPETIRKSCRYCGPACKMAYPRAQRKILTDGRLPMEPTLHLGRFEYYAERYRSLIDVIIVDPPYARGALPIYEALAEFALATLVPGGWLLCLTGWGISYDVETIFRAAHLEYITTCAYLTVGGRLRAEKHTSTGLRIWNQCSKPLLWYQKPGDKTGQRRAGPTHVIGYEPKKTRDYNQDDGDPDGFHWQQSLSSFQQIIRNFTNAQDVICDPCMGSTTTILASLSMGRRRVIGIEKDADTYRKAQARLRAYMEAQGSAELLEARDLARRP